MPRITIRVTPDLALLLEGAARSAGITQSRWIRELVIERIAHLDASQTGNGARLSELERQVTVIAAYLRRGAAQVRLAKEGSLGA